MTMTFMRYGNKYYNSNLFSSTLGGRGASQFYFQQSANIGQFLNRHIGLFIEHFEAKFRQELIILGTF